MSAVFLGILKLSIRAGWLILAVIPLRILLQKSPKWIYCVLWGLVGIRLVCPVSLPGPFSLIPHVKLPVTDTYHIPLVNAGITVINEASEPIHYSTYTVSQSVGSGTEQGFRNVFTAVWIIGVVLMLVYALFSYLKLKRTVSASIPEEEDIMVCDDISSPFILGIIHPLIYLPSGLDEKVKESVISHERAHLQRHDHWWKPLGWLVLSIHWFNPLCWLAYILLCRDIEAACDEKVIRTMDRQCKAAYSEALLACRMQRRMITACPVAFGETGVKQRVRSILSYRKPALWIIIVSVLVCIIAGIGFLSDPAADTVMDEKLASSLEAAAREHHGYTTDPRPGFTAVDADVMKIVQEKDSTTVYAWIMCEKYAYDGGKVSHQSGSHIPTVITFDTSSDREDIYPVKEYWQPRDGSYYAGDIRAKFPILLWQRAFDVSGSEAQSERCRAKAEAYFAENGSSGGIQVNVKTAWAGWSDDSRIFTESLNPETMLISSYRHLPVYKAETAEELRNLRSTFADILTLNQGHDEVPSFDETISGYDESFFDKHTLVLAYVSASSGTFRYAADDISTDDSVFSVIVRQTNDPEVYTSDMAGWFIIAEVPKDLLAGITGYDAWLDHHKEPVTYQQNPGMIEYGSFSYKEERNSLSLIIGRDQQIRTEGFVHTETVDFVLPEDIAREEVTIKYDLIQKFYDETEDIWKIRFFSSDPSAGEQTVYLDGQGITRLIVYSK
ncbi:MAG: M56 family metallopeptidase [Solobacterium sp.]|nr:M56 family metallopeptidase [Solobacterium sp.]